MRASLMMGLLFLWLAQCLGQQVSTNVAPIRFRSIGDRPALLNQIHQIQEAVVRHDTRLIRAQLDSMVTINHYDYDADSLVHWIENAFVFNSGDTAVLHMVYDQAVKPYSAIFNFEEARIGNSTLDAFTDISSLVLAPDDTVSVYVSIRSASYLPPINARLVYRKKDESNLLPMERFILCAMENTNLLEAIESYANNHAALHLKRNGTLPPEWADKPVSAFYNYPDDAPKPCMRRITSFTLSSDALVHVPIEININGTPKQFASLNKSVANSELNRDLIGSIADMVVTQNSGNERQLYIQDGMMQRVLLGILGLGYIKSMPFRSPVTGELIGDSFINLKMIANRLEDGLITYDYATDTLKFHSLDLASPTGMTLDTKIKHCDSAKLEQYQIGISEIYPDPQGIETWTTSTWKSYAHGLGDVFIHRAAAGGMGAADKIYRGVRSECSAGAVYDNFSEGTVFSFPRIYHSGTGRTQLRWSNGMVSVRDRLYYMRSNPTLRKMQLEDTLVADIRAVLQPAVTRLADIRKILRTDDGDFILLDGWNGFLHIIDGEYGDYLCSIADEGGELFQGLSTAALVEVANRFTQSTILAECYDIYIAQRWNGPVGLRRFLLGADILNASLARDDQVDYARISFTLPTRSRIDVLRMPVGGSGTEEYVYRDLVLESGKRHLDTDVTATEYVRIRVLPEGVDEYIHSNVPTKEVLLYLDGVVKERRRDNGNPGSIASLEIYPNPVKDVLRIRLNSHEPGMYSFSIHDVRGVLMFDRTIYTYSPVTDFSVDIAGLPRGLYFVSVRDGMGARNKSFIKH